LNKLVAASRPPADAPIPTTGKRGEAVGAPGAAPRARLAFEEVFVAAMSLLCYVKVLRNQKLRHGTPGPLLMLERILPFREVFVAMDAR
jgi:hypothetical protein